MNYERLLAPLRRRMATLIGRCILSAVQSGEGFQTLDVVIMADESMGGVEHAEPYGFTSNPHPGAEGVVLNVAGQRASCVALNPGNRQYRLRGFKTGEVALYTDEGDKRLKNELSRMIDITPYSLGTRQTWVSWIVTTMFTSGDGNAFVLPASRNGRIEELLPMPGATTLPQDNGLSYSIQWRGQMFAPDNVLHFRLHPDPAAPWRGRGPRVPLRAVPKTPRQAAATTNAFMSSRWMPSVIIKVDSNSEELRDPSGREKLMHEYIQTQRAGEPWMIPAELMDVVTVKPLSLADIAISSSVEMDKRCVAAAIRVPPYFLGVGEDSEAASTIMNPNIRTINLISMESLSGAITGYLPFGQSLLLVWPHLAGMTALMTAAFAGSYVSFMRQEIRS